MLPADDGIHFPVTQAFSGIDDGWTLFNTATIVRLTSSIIRSVPFAAFLLAPQVLVQIAAGLLIDSPYAVLGKLGR